MVILDEHSAPSLNSLVYDILFRPTQLEHVNMWDQFSLYEKIRISGKKKTSAYNDDTDSETDELVSLDMEFADGHPQKSTHTLRKRKIIHIPVLSGTPIPRRDLKDQIDKYALVVLALFQPWERSSTLPLKAESVSWASALAKFLASAPQSTLDIIDHVQEQWECRLAADDYSAEYKARQADFAVHNGIPAHLDAMSELAGDLDWQLGQLDDAVGASQNPDTPEIADFEEFSEASGSRTKLATQSTIALAEAAKFYHIPILPGGISTLLHGHAIESLDDRA
ncbi:hypothetical protein B0H15DRAFT_573139, partial [Mycena belliarum]